MRLVADNLTIDRGGRRVLAGVSFALAAGEALFVTGRNGAGKSTLLRALAGLLQPSAGRLRWEAAVPAHEPDAAAATQAHYIGHADGLKAALTAGENLTFWQAMLAVSGGAGNLDPEAALARFGLGQLADFPVRYLSAGQKRRVALARLLVAARPLWLLDEPTATLDGESRGIFGGTMLRHLGEGGIIVAATHVPLGLEPTHELRLGESP